jgi:probable HAF family extracellular repeat protein
MSVSADGSVVVGYSVDKGPGGYRAFRWTAREGMQPLTLRPEGGEAVESVARRVSADGAVIVGWMRNEKGRRQVAFRWTREEGMLQLGFLPGAHPVSPSY